MAETTARKYASKQTHFIDRTIAYNSREIWNGAETAASDGLYIGTIPAESFITGVWAGVTEAFDAGTTNVLTIGTNSTDYNNLADSGAIDETAVATTFGIADGQYVSSDTDVFVKYTQSGSAATAGSAIVLIEYCPLGNGS